MFRSVRAALCALALAPAPVLAAEPAAQPSPAKVSPRSLECATRYNTAMRMEDTMRAMTESMMPMMMAQLPEAKGSVDKAQRDAVMAAVAETMSDITSRMMDDLAPVMAESFSETELCVLADFYASETGQAIVDKMPAFATASAAVAGKYSALMQDEMLKRLCAKIDCGALATPTKANRQSS